MFGVPYKLWRFFGRSAKGYPLVTREFPLLDLPNLQRALDDLASEERVQREVLGFQGYGGLSARSVVGAGRCTFAPLQYRDVDIAFDEQMRCMTNGLHLISTPRRKFAVLVTLQEAWPVARIRVEVLCRSEEDAGEFLNDQRRRVAELSVYRGKVISIEQGGGDNDEPGFVNVRFHEQPNVTSDDIVLPNDVMRLVERNSVSFFRHSRQLRDCGRSLKRGLLLHGPPGTGKTLTLKWLASTLERVTVIQVAGEQLWHVKECCQMARMLAPAMIVMEDVDLIAAERQSNTGQTALHQLLNEMDGLDSEAEVIFVLTTNRPDVIESALANRPGRVDQAIQFPLPDDECRSRLLRMFGQGLDISEVDLDDVVRRTDGATPAFIRELVRKAALISAEEALCDNGVLRPSQGCFRQALEEMVAGDGQLTRRLLGFRAASNSSQ